MEQTLADPDQAALDAIAALAAALPDDRRDDAHTRVDGDVARRALDQLARLHNANRALRLRTEKAVHRAQQILSTNGALMVDRDRARNWAAELAESALHAAAERGIDADDVRAQIAHDRHLRWLQLREEVWHQSGFEAVMGVLHGPSRHQESVPRRVLMDALDANKRHAEVDRRCGKTYDAKTPPDMSTPPRREVELPVQGDLFTDPTTPAPAGDAPDQGRAGDDDETRKR